jgi:hypothetical protein
MTPQERRLRARAGGLAVHAKYGSDFIAARARAGIIHHFEHKVDPEGRLDPEERRERAILARKAHMASMSIKASQARRKGVDKAHHSS